MSATRPVITCPACHQPGMAAKSLAKYNGCLQVLGLPFLLGGLVALLMGVAAIFAVNTGNQSAPSSKPMKAEERQAAETGQAVAKGVFGMGATALCVIGGLGVLAGGSLSLSKRSVWHCKHCGTQSPRA